MDDLERRAAESRIALVFELVGDGIDLTRERLRREDPAASVREIEDRVEAWLHSRPGAPHGDADGRPVELPFR